MDIQSFTLIAVELTQRLKTARKTSSVDNWQCGIIYDLGNNAEGDVIQILNLFITRTNKTHIGTLIARTSFLLKLGSVDLKPTTEKDFEVYTFFATLAMSHARALFMREANGTTFAGDILPCDNPTGIRNKLVLSVNINSN